MLFKDRERNFDGPANYSESHFSFLDRSSQEEAKKVRNLLEEWFSHYPDDNKRKEFLKRFKSQNDISFISSFFELYTHELLFRLGYKIIPHPNIPFKKTKPDFLVQSPDGDDLYLECVLVTDTNKIELAKNKIKNSVYDIINKIDSPDFFIGMNLKGAPESSPPAKKIKSIIEKWLRNINPDIMEQRELDDYPKLYISYDGWDLEVFPILKSQKSRGKNGQKIIGTQMPEVKWEAPYIVIRDVIKSKVSRYGKFNKPYIIAINVLNLSIQHIDIMNALFGLEKFVISMNSSLKRTRTQDGVFLNKSGIQNTRISGILVCDDISPWSIANRESRLYHNPWAKFSCKGEITKLSEASFYNGNYELKEGIHPRILFNLPPQWPFE